MSAAAAAARARQSVGVPGVVGALLVLLVVLLGVLAPLLSGYGPTEQLAGAHLLPPGPGHPLGTDALDRDIASRVLHGTRTTLAVCAVAVPLGAVLGTLAGLLATVHPGLDVVAQRTFDLLLAFPAVVLGTLVAVVAGPGVLTVVVVVVVAELPVVGRVVRGRVLQVRELAFVESARASGAGTGWVLRRHVLPHVLAPVAVQVAAGSTAAVFVESALSFLGVGIRPPTPSLGSLVADSLTYLEVNPWFALAPLAVVGALGLGFLLLAQAVGRATRD